MTSTSATPGATAPASARLTDEQLRELHRWLVLERVLDRRTNESFRVGKVMSMFHSASGQEAANVGAAYALRDGDAFLPGHRGRAMYLIRGMDLDVFVGGLYGKREGFARGHTMVGSHMCGDASIGLMPASGAVGSSSAVAVGGALALKLRGEGGAALVVTGDGAANRGDVHEAMNFASALSLPVVFLVISNGWALSVPAEHAQSVDRLSARAAGYGMEGVTIDGLHVLAVYDAVSAALERARTDLRPTLVEVKIRRAGAHSVNDPDLYRSDAERELDRTYDPVEAFELTLRERGLLDDAAHAAVWSGVEAEVAGALARADAGTEPGLEDLLHGVYAEPGQEA